jgi:ribosomal protein S18 acetylase RimI-like enzyme
MSLSQTHPDQLLAAQRNAELGIIAVPSERRSEAIVQLVSTGPHDDRGQSQRFLEYARGHGISLDTMWSLVDGDDRIVATVLAVPSPGRTAMVFASRLRSPQQIAAHGRLIDHAAAQLAHRNVHLAQMLLDPSETLERQAALAGRFIELARLSYQERPVPRARNASKPTWPAGIETLSYTDEQRPEVLDALAASYERTLDCPGLLGLRETSDILDGHQASGQFDPRLWTLLRVDGRPAGVLLLNPSSGLQAVELVYLGLAPFARGRGLGKRLLAHGLALLAGRRERSINLAVDEANVPALRLYAAAGFRGVLRRTALIRPLRVLSSSS